MKTPFLSKRQFNKIKPLLPVRHAGRRHDDLVVISGILWVIRHSIPWRQLPEIYGKWNTVYRRFLLWSKAGIFERILRALSMKLKKRHTAMIDSTYVKGHRTAASLRADPAPGQTGRSRGGITTKIHLLCNEEGKPPDFLITPGNSSDIKMAPVLILANQNRMKILIADKAYDSDAFRDLLRSDRVQGCIPPKSTRKNPQPYDRQLYGTRHVIENMFARLKDWRGVATRYCRCAHTASSFVHLP